MEPRKDKAREAASIIATALETLEEGGFVILTEEGRRLLDELKKEEVRGEDEDEDDHEVGQAQDDTSD